MRPSIGDITELALQPYRPTGAVRIPRFMLLTMLASIPFMVSHISTIMSTNDYLRHIGSSSSTSPDKAEHYDFIVG